MEAVLHTHSRNTGEGCLMVRGLEHPEQLLAWAQCSSRAVHWLELVVNICPGLHSFPPNCFLSQEVV